MTFSPFLHIHCSFRVAQMTQRLQDFDRPLKTKSPRKCFETGEKKKIFTIFQKKKKPVTSVTSHACNDMQNISVALRLPNYCLRTL